MNDTDVDFPEMDIPDLEDGFDLEDFETDDAFDDDIDTRYIEPKHKPFKQSRITYSHALKLAREIELSKGGRYDAIVSGDFIFGDFIEAFITLNNCKCRQMTISTLSLGQNNVDSLRNLIVGGYVDNLDMVVSHYFYSNERLSLIPYMYKQLDVDNRFQLSVASIHTKTAQFETAGGLKIVIHGSANLRSNGNIEQFTVEENPELYDFYDGVFGKIKERYMTINKAVRRGIYD